MRHRHILRADTQLEGKMSLCSERREMMRGLGEMDAEQLGICCRCKSAVKVGISVQERAQYVKWLLHIEELNAV